MPESLAETAELTLRPAASSGLAAAMAFCQLKGDVAESRALPLLAAPERARADTFRVPGARDDFLRGRLAAKAALARLGGAPPSEFSIAQGVFRQPLVAPPHAGLGITLSHGAQAALAVAFPLACPLGIDLERISEDRIDLLRSQVPRREEAALCALGLAPAAALTLAWCAREAISKVLGGGLAIDGRALALCDLQRHGDVVAMNAAQAGHLRVEARLAAHGVAALALPRGVACDWSCAAPWLARIGAAQPGGVQAGGA